MRINWSGFFLIIFLFLSYSLILANDYDINIIQSSSSQMTISIEFEEPRLENESGEITAHYSSSKQVIGLHGASIPMITKLFNLGVANADLTISIQEIEYKSVSVDFYRRLKNLPARAEMRKERFETKYLGKYRELPLYALHIFPVKYDSNSKKLNWIHKARIKISTGTSSGLPTHSVQPANLSINNILRNDLLNTKNNLYADAVLEVVETQVMGNLSENPVFNNTDHIYKIRLDEDGLYKITFNDLLSAGYPVSSVNPKKLRLYNKGVEVPVYFSGSEDNQFNAGDYFEFWGEKNEKTFLEQYPELWADPFTDINVYWLVESNTNGLRMVEENGSLVKTQPGTFIRPYAFREILHFEENKHRETFGHQTANLNRPSYEIDHWFYDDGISAVESRSYEFVLNHPYEFGSKVYVTAAFRGRSIQENVKHQLALWLNQQKVGEVSASDNWQHQQLKFVTNEGTSGLLQENLLDGVNTIRVDMEQPGVTDMVMLNWFNVTYLRQYKANEDFLKFRVQDGLPREMTPQFEISGFSKKEIQIYKLGVSKIVNGPVDYFEDYNRSGSYRVSFQDDVFDANVEYVALSEANKKKALQIVAYEYWENEIDPLALLNNSNSGDYLIITHQDFEFNARKLKTLKEDQGLNPRIIMVDQIYDIFNFGIKSPLAIKDFISYVYSDWSKVNPLQYVVFLGDGAYNTRSSGDKVPTMLFETHKFGAAAADYWFSLISGDDYIPDIIVSRIPAGANEELDNYLKKVESYQSGTDLGLWRNKALFISGNDAGVREAITNKPIFRSQSLRLINRQLPENIFTRRLNTVQDEKLGNDDPDFGSTTDLIELFDEGLSFVNFLGHGGGAIWSDVQLMNVNDVNRLNNQDKYPFVSSLTCFTGAFENAGRKSLGEQLLLADEKGAIGVLASSGVGWAYNDLTIGWSLFDFLWQDDISIGQAVNLMKIYYQSDPTYFTEDVSFTTYSFYELYPSMIFQYNLFGDPALQLQKPVTTIDIQVSNHTPLPGDTVQVSRSAGLSGAPVKLEITNEDNYRIVETDFEAGEIYKFIIPDSSDGARYRIKAYQDNGSQDASGFTEMAVRSSLIKKVIINPPKPQVNDLIHFQVVVKSFAEIDTMTLINFSEIRNKYKFIYGYQLPMVKVSDTLFQSITPFPGFEVGGHKLFDINVETSEQEAINFRWQKMYVQDNRPELAFAPKSFGYTGSDSLKMISAFVNESDSVLKNIKVLFFNGSGIQSGESFAEAVFNLSAREEKRIEVVFSPEYYEQSRDFRVIIDPDNLIAEKDENNNILDRTIETDHILIEKKIGTSLDKINNDTLFLHDRWHFHVAQQMLSKSTILFFSEKNITLEDQSDIQSAISNSSGDPVAMQLHFLNYTDKLNVPATLSIKIDSTWSDDFIQTLSFYRFEQKINRWIRQSGTIDQTQIKTDVYQSGSYTVLSNTDTKNPIIEITVDGRTLRSRMYLVQRPDISFIVQDENGIDLDRSLQIYIDESPLSQDDISYPEEIENPNTISILATPELDPGNHTLQVEVSDVNGNITTAEVEFIVSNQFDFIVFGNYPNPFAEKTRISYRVTGEDLDDLTVKIYTTSGKLIRSRMLEVDPTVPDDNVLGINYHEVVWDGTDDEGNQVANGVYFCVISGSYAGESISHTIKMARLQ